MREPDPMRFSPLSLSFAEACSVIDAINWAGDDGQGSKELDRLAKRLHSALISSGVISVPTPR